MGYEESYGYLVGSHAKDKDAVVASMLICEMAAYHKAQGKTLLTRLEELYQQHGYYQEALDSFTLPGADGQQHILFFGSIHSQPTAPRSDCLTAVQTVLHSTPQCPRGRSQGPYPVPDRRRFPVRKRWPAATLPFPLDWGNAPYGEEYHAAFQKAVLQQGLLADSASKENLRVVYTPLHGTGLIPVTTVLEKDGFTQIYVLESQREPDGTFCTVHSPNPEEKEALQLAIAYGQEIGADLVLGTDPDCDRVDLFPNILKAGEYIHHLHSIGVRNLCAQLRCHNRF